MAESNEILNRVHDQVAGINRVTLFPATSKRLVDYSDSSNIYVGVAAAGTATSALKSWLIERISPTVGSVSITHATDSWDNRASAAYS